MPTSMLMNLDANTLQEKYFRLKLDAALPLKKQMWKNVVENKIKKQAGLLKCLGKNADREFAEIYSHFGNTKAPKKWPKSQD